MLKKMFFVSALLALAFLSFGITQGKTDVAGKEGFNLSERMEVPDDMAQKILELREEIQANGYTFTVDYNPAMRYSLDELCGFRPQTYKQGQELPNPFAIEPMAVPTSWDWRSNSGVTPVKDQASCGSCWAFSIVGAFESAIKIKDATTVDLSEQYLVSCNSLGYGCSGGFFDANDMHVSPGADLESCFPYTGTDSSCKSTCAHPYKLSSWAYVGSSSGVPATSSIQTAIYNYGPVECAVYANTAMQSYSGGIFNGTASGSPNHAVLLVGWDGTNGCWIMKNSWGTSWGESGFMRIKYGSQQIGYAAAYVVYSGGSTTPTLSVALNPTTLTLASNTSGTSTATTTIGGGFNSAVTLSVSGVPTGASASFSSTTIAAPGSGTSTLTVNSGTATAGTYTLTVTATGGSKTATATLSLTISSTSDVTVITNGQTVTGISVSASSWKYYMITVPSGQTSLKVTTSGGSGDADLYVKLGAKPTTSVYDGRSAGSTNAETVTISSPTAGSFYIGVYGYAASSGISLTATYTGGSGTNMALNRPVTVYASYNSTSYPPSNMVDGSTSTYWVSGAISTYGATQYAYVDLGATKTISKIVLQFSTTNYPTTYYIQRYDGSAWVNVTQVAGTGGTKTITYSTPWTSQYVRVYMTANYSSYYTIYELQVY